VGAKKEQAALAAQLRTEGATWAQVVDHLRTRWGLNARQTMRITRGWSQQQVADEWCRRWPDDPKTFKNISTWERWPEHGHAPSLVVLDQLAQIYRCSVPTSSPISATTGSVVTMSSRWIAGRSSPVSVARSPRPLS
jgi:hypothetical protein